MSKNTIVISVELRETRVALIEDGIIAELHIERKANTKVGGAVGDVYLGRVTRVLPGLQAAFIDIGLERAAFLHVEDLIRPDDFEAYLAGGRKHARGAADDEHVTEVVAEDAAEGTPLAVLGQTISIDDSGVHTAALLADAAAREHEQEHEGDEAASDDDSAPIHVPARADTADAAVSLPDLTDDAQLEDDDALLGVGGEETPSGGPFDLAVSDPDVSARHRDDDDDTPLVASVAAHEDDEDDVADEEHEAAVDDGEAAGDDEDDDEEPSIPPPAPVAATKIAPFDMPDLPGFTVSEPGEPTPRAQPPRVSEGPERRGRGRGRRGRSRGRGDRQDSPAPRGPEKREGGGGGRAGAREGGRGGGGGNERHSLAPGRISKSTPIRDVVREGQEIIVQITKEPIGTKGARCSSHVSLPGRYVVYLPTVEHVGISKRIGSDRERARLRETIAAIKPPTGGLIVRTLAEGLTKKHLKQDVGYLVRLWGEIAKEREGAKAPELLSSELDIVLKTARDLFTDEVDQIVIDDRREHERLSRFVEMFMPERLKDVILYQNAEPIFDEYGIEDEIGRALSRKVPLPSGGHLIIDQAEALTAIDVNTGRFVGKGSKDMEETILKTNLEAVQEIAYQLRFRNIGGLIILDLIDMERAQNREKVRRKLEDVLQKDKAKTTLNRISDLGLIEMTRKRTRESLGRIMNEPCFYCDGTGHLQSKETIAYEILREIRRKRRDLPGYTVIVNAHPAVADILQGPEKEAVAEAENRYMRKITVVARKEYHYEQFDLTGK